VLSSYDVRVEIGWCQHCPSLALTIDESEAISPAWQDLLQVVNSGLEAAEYQGFRG
jgi:hypothetical protein